MMRYLIDTDVMMPTTLTASSRPIPLHAELGAAITGLAYELLKRHAKSDGLRTFDSLIAATAIKEGLTLVSKNRKYFQVIGELNLAVPNY
jgi:predicted nucleic acid-binding protein